jgi:hypothetical protein
VDAPWGSPVEAGFVAWEVARDDGHIIVRRQRVGDGQAEHARADDSNLRHRGRVQSGLAQRERPRGRAIATCLPPISASAIELPYPRSTNPDPSEFLWQYHQLNLKCVLHPSHHI